MYQRGEIVLVDFPFSDLSASKLRPALICSNERIASTRDYLLIPITSKRHNDGLSLTLMKEDYNGQILPEKSELRFYKITALSRVLLKKRITRVTDEFMDEVIGRFMKLIR